MSRTASRRNPTLLRRPSGAAPAGGGTPPLLTTDLVLRYRADNVTEGATMTWHNQGSLGSAWDLTQGTAGAQPGVTQANAAYNDKPTIDFDGIDDHLMTAALAGTIAQPWTMYVVCDATGATQVVTDDGGSTNNTGIFYASGQWQGRAPTALTETVAIGAVHAFALQANGVSSAFYRDDFTTAKASGNAGTNAIRDLTVGATNTPSAFMSGSVAEVFVFAALHAAQSAGAAAYLNAHYGLSV